MKYLLIILGLLLVSSVFLYKYKTADEFVSYQNEWGKHYSNDEVEFRRAVFYENKAKIDAWNAQPNKEHWEVINMFTDMTQDEFERNFLGLEVGPRQAPVSSSDNPITDVDWTKKGEPFNKVKNQGACGSCWAFSAVGGMEGIWNIKKGEVKYFAEQMLVDCSKSYGNHGCNGGLMTYAYKFIMDHGIVTEDKYPYVARDQSCKITDGPNKVAYYTEIKSCNDQAQQLQTQPIAIAADASRWSSYGGGVFSNCGKRLNHGITLVGLYTKGDAQPYWYVKNSWGARWGEKGFIKLKYPGSTCGCCDMSCYPSL